MLKYTIHHKKLTRHTILILATFSISQLNDYIHDCPSTIFSHFLTLHCLTLSGKEFHIPAAFTEKQSCPNVVVPLEEALVNLKPGLLTI